MLAAVSRIRQDVVMPLSNPIRGVDGTMIHEIFVPKDTTVVIGILALNRSKAIWGEDAEEWKPERWLSPLPESVAEAKVPGIYSNLCVYCARSSYVSSGKLTIWLAVWFSWEAAVHACRSPYVSDSRICPSL